jgi:hypothetical protein
MLVGRHYQNGYICDDIEECHALFRARGLDRDPQVIDVEQEVSTPSGPKKQQMKICMFWLNGVQYELIQPIVDETNIYANAPSNGGPMRFHHICLRVDDWDAFRKQVAEQDLPVVMERDLGPDALRFCYLDGRKVFGHYLEYTHMSDEMWKHIEAM